MRLMSSYVAPVFDEDMGRRLVLTVFDTLVDDRKIVVGITTGVVGATLEDARLSPIGMRVMAQVMDHHKLNYPETAPVIFAGVQRVSNAVQRVRNVLRNAPDGAALLIVCADDKVYDAAFPALGVDFKSANMNPH